MALLSGPPASPQPSWGLLPAQPREALVPTRGKLCPMCQRQQGVGVRTRASLAPAGYGRIGDSRFGQHGYARSPRVVLSGPLCGPHPSPEAPGRGRRPSAPAGDRLRDSQPHGGAWCALRAANQHWLPMPLAVKSWPSLCDFPLRGWRNPAARVFRALEIVIEK